MNEHDKHTHADHSGHGHHGHEHHHGPAAGHGKGVEYTCPMHPEVSHDGPGSCPKCGMALEPRVPVAAKPTPGTKWTCPMHPQIVQDGPGSCPICGMALEPMRPASTDEEENPELKEMSR